MEMVKEKLNTNFILKKVISTRSKYARRSFVNFLRVDIENCNPIDFSDQKYIKSQHEKCIFLFIDKDYNIIGILEGNKHNDVFFEFESYSKIPKNRKNLTANAEYILMITPEMRTLKLKQKNYSCCRHQDLLRRRLLDYKIKKYKNVTYEEVFNMVHECVSYLNENLFNKDFRDNIYKNFRYYEVRHAMSIILDLGDNFYRTYEEYKNSKDNLYCKDYILNDLIKYKIDIITFRNKLFKLKEQSGRIISHFFKKAVYKIYKMWYNKNVR